MSPGHIPKGDSQGRPPTISTTSSPVRRPQNFTPTFLSSQSKSLTQTVVYLYFLLACFYFCIKWVLEQVSFVLFYMCYYFSSLGI